MKKMTKLSLMLLIMLLAMSTGLMAQAYSGGSGTSEDPYQIANKADLKYLSENTGEWSKHFKQTANIIFASSDFDDGGDFYNSGAGFIPIGTEAIKFTGTYNGNGHTIDNLFINRSSTNYIGLFGYTSGATIQNIGVTNIDITGGECTGGLVGLNYESEVSNSYSTGSVSGVGGVGGLVGANYYYSTVSNSYSTGSVSGHNCIGGLVGENFSSSTVSNSYSTGNVSGTGDGVGGLVGLNYYYSTISNSYSTGSVSGTYRDVGGLVGLNYSSSTVSNSYSTGSVSGTGDGVGGLVGFNYISTISNSFWDTATSGTEIGIGKGTTTGVTGKTTDEMKDIATFTDETKAGLTTAWDFETNPNDDDANENYWDIDGSDAINSGYPFLSWQNGDAGDEVVLFTLTPNSYVLQSAYPNPFNPTFILPLQLNENAFVNVELVNILGQEVMQIENKQMSIGNNDLQINCENLSSGVYFIKVTIDNVNEIQKVVLLK